MKCICCSLLAMLLLGLSSCMQILGIKKHHYVGREELARRDARAGRHTAVVFDTSTVKTIYKTALPKDVKKNLVQPMQVWVLTPDKVVCNKVNCYCKGFPNLKWQLPAMYASHFICEPVADKEVPVIRNLFQVPPQQADTTMVITYAFVMGRQSKRFLRACNKLHRQHPSFNTWYVNMDNTFK